MIVLRPGISRTLPSYVSFLFYVYDVYPFVMPTAKRSTVTPASPPPVGEEPRTLTLSLDPDLNRFLRAQARRENRPISWVAGRLLRAGIQAEQITIPTEGAL